MKNNSLNFRLTLVVSLVLACCALAHAQSGRRNVPSSPPPPVPTPTPEPTPKPKQDEEKEPSIYFVIGAEQNSTTSYFPISYYDAVIRGCAEALRKGSSAGIDVLSRDLGRGEAIKKAKADQRTYVVHLVLSARTMSGSQSSSYDDAEVEYTVFAPQTGKIATSGRTYQNANRAGPLVVGPTGTSSALYREKLLMIAGQDAGERIVKALHLTAVGNQ